MTSDETHEPCETCHERTGEEPHTCPYRIAIAAAGKIPAVIGEAHCNCCDTCAHECRLRSLRAKLEASGWTFGEAGDSPQSGGMAYVYKWQKGPHICLDGEFTGEELEALGAWLKAQ